MALVLSDRVQETSTTSGTGTLTLNGAVNGYQSFANGVGNGNTCYYTIYDTVAYTWEVGIGTYTTSGSTLTRTTVLSNSSQTTSLINFAGNLMNVWVDYPAEKAIYQDASGNTYVPSLGGTTPSTGTFTTITGQTETLKGTGENLFTYSTSLTNGAWPPSNITFTTGQTDPFGGTNAVLANDGTATGTHQIFQGVVTTTQAYTFSIYAKVGTSNYIGIYSNSASRGAIFNVSTGAFSANIGGAPTSYSITNAGNSWYRVSITFTGVSGTDYPIVYMSENGTTTSFTGTSQTVYISSPQFEIGNTLNTYVPTTSAAVYGTPTLSFSGVSTIGLQNDGSLFVQPAGTGALQAQQTTSSATGGNARGANAVDWQTSRGSATQVSSGQQSIVVGGYGNTTSQPYGVTVGGYTNNNVGYAGSILGGVNNQNQAYYNTVVGGQLNYVNGLYSFIGGGYSNGSATQVGYYNFIGGGQSNTGTLTAAVTTQATSTITSGSTAVTLSGSNASIKVGQFISGTPIANNTYVAAISGTSLTLSQNATSSTNATLSFYTPHGVVVGGGNNQATGAYSFIGGGGDAGTSANRNVASGDWGVVVGGNKNSTGSGLYNFIGGGQTNTITASTTATIVGGGTNSVAGYGGFVGGGYSNSASGPYSVVVGGQGGTTRSIAGAFNFASNFLTRFGDAQMGFYVLGVQTTDATSVVLTTTYSAASSTNQVILPNNSAYSFRATIIAGVTGAGNTASWILQGAIKRGSGVGTTAIVGTVNSILLAQDSGASTWAVSATADTTNGGLAITVTGQAATTIRWVCKVETTEMTF